MYGSALSSISASRGTKKLSQKLSKLMRELSDDEDDTIPSPSAAATSSTQESSGDPNKPWLADFHGYLNSRDHLGDNTIVQWWGLNATRYPVWASLARDYLSIMASSVLSECAFSSAGITISKRHNRLNADIVEAL
ncbi:hypothetical protein SCP_0112300 [Sparassis crispa]|uniref:HAT C-terminal dimerisation domain-containing protein n=1 Tax=Sparassis crispa TaxID=139825 RepID=A0A401G844_9APHY|nr:hypothetical protein SCP_0112300 [Sparassis crispa]GBE78345.1 hypothetical protein SCP_0112300 [Sparassis crispa]